MKRAIQRTLLAVVVIPIALILAVVAIESLNRPTPPLPPLLQGATAHGGYWGACPPENDTEAMMMRGGSAASPELSQRLMNKFPVGSSEDHFSKTLIEQGFKIYPSCKSDPSIHTAGFKQDGGGIFLYPMTAQIFWKVDQNDAIVWIKGFVAFTGL